MKYWSKPEARLVTKILINQSCQTGLYYRGRETSVFIRLLLTVRCSALRSSADRSARMASSPASDLPERPNLIPVYP